MFAIPIPIIGISGPYDSGKTVFGLSVNPDPATTVAYDLEKSSETYVELGNERVDVAVEMARAYPTGYKPYQLWLWWRADVLARLAEGKYRAVLIDPASELEDSLDAYIMAFPQKFNLTSGQIAKMPGVKWGVMKAVWKQMLADVAAKCECLVFVVHQRTKYEGGQATKKKEARGKSTLMELATLFLEMQRDKTVSPIPSAKVLKSRLCVFRPDAEGNRVPMPVLPDFLRQATPAQIRWYIANPVGLRQLTDAEKAPPEPELAEADRLVMEQQLQQTRLEAAKAETEALREKDKLEKTIARIKEQNAAEEAMPDETPSPSAPVALAPIQPGPNPQSVLEKLRSEAFQRGMDEKTWGKILTKYGARHGLAQTLEEDQLKALISSLASKLDMMDLHDALYAKN